MSRSRSHVLVGRDLEVERLEKLVGDVAAGRGNTVWVEGEPGIGKTTLLGVALAGAEMAGCQLFRGRAEKLGERFPLRVLLESFNVTNDSADPQRAEIAALLRSDPAAVAAADPVVPAAERLLAFIDRLCAAAPVVLLVDDMQWADEASLAVWARLSRSIDQVPLLLVGACRPVHGRREVASLRSSLASAGAVMLPLGALTADQSADVVSALVARPGPRLRRLVARAGGNPLYIREIVDAVLREQRASVRDGVAELSGERPEGPTSLAAAIADRLGFLSDETASLLRLAALLGPEFTATDLATVTGQTALDLLPAVQEGVAVGVLTERGMHLAFRHALIHQALTETIPAGLRSALHLQAAHALMAAEASMERVVEQLLATQDFARLGRGWVLDWMVQEGTQLVYRAPQLAAELIEGVLDELPLDDPHRDRLGGLIVTAAWLDSRDDDVERHARQVLAYTHDPAQKAQVSWTLAYVLGRTGRCDVAIEVCADAVASPGTSPVWSARLSAMHSMALGGAGRYDEAKVVARQALAAAEEAADGFATAYALHGLSQLPTPLTDLSYFDRALAIVGENADTNDLRLMLLGNRAYALEELDRMGEAVAAAREASRLAERFGSRARRPTSRTVLASILFAAGEWDDALAELDAVDSPYAAIQLLTHGLRAVIAIHRDDRASADEAMRLLRGQRHADGVTRMNSLQARWASVLAAERDGELRCALDLAAVELDPDLMADSTVKHGWQPHVVRLALAVGDTAAARAVAEGCVEDAGARAVPALRAAASRCEGLLNGDPRRLLWAVAHYRAAGRPLELGNTLEEAAVLHAQRGEMDEARIALQEAVDVYDTLSADWDARRVVARVRPYGLRRGQRGLRRRPASGWGALTPTEVRVADLVAEGKSNPDIAATMFLSRRTVQTHVSHILAKLGASSRIEIASQKAANS